MWAAVTPIRRSLVSTKHIVPPPTILDAGGRSGLYHQYGAVISFASLSTSARSSFFLKPLPAATITFALLRSKPDLGAALVSARLILEESPGSTTSSMGPRDAAASSYAP